MKKLLLLLLLVGCAKKPETFTLFWKPDTNVAYWSVGAGPAPYQVLQFQITKEPKVTVKTIAPVTYIMVQAVGHTGLKSETVVLTYPTNYAKGIK